VRLVNDSVYLIGLKKVLRLKCGPYIYVGRSSFYKVCVDVKVSHLAHDPRKKSGKEKEIYICYKLTLQFLCSGHTSMHQQTNQ